MFIENVFCIVNIDIFYVLITLEILTTDLTKIVNPPLKKNVVLIFQEV